MNEINLDKIIGYIGIGLICTTPIILAGKLIYHYFKTNKYTKMQQLAQNDFERANMRKYDNEILKKQNLENLI